MVHRTGASETQPRFRVKLQLPLLFLRQFRKLSRVVVCHRPASCLRQMPYHSQVYWSINYDTGDTGDTGH